jgi:hypothetical protein
MAPESAPGFATGLATELATESARGLEAGLEGASKDRVHSQARRRRGRRCTAATGRREPPARRGAWRRSDRGRRDRRGNVRRGRSRPGRFVRRIADRRRSPGPVSSLHEPPARPREAGAIRGDEIGRMIVGPLFHPKRARARSSSIVPTSGRKLPWGTCWR